MPTTPRIATTDRDYRFAGALTLLCAALSTGFWLLFHDRTHYEDFQALFPLILWLMLVVLHAILGTAALGLAYSSAGFATRLMVTVYFGGALVIHLMTAADYIGWNERVYTRLANTLNPKDGQLHSLLDEQTVDTKQIAQLIQAGANPDSWRGTWAIWKVWRHQDVELLNLLLVNGANPDRSSRSGTSHLAFVYQVDGWVEKWVMLRDQSTTLLCDHLANGSHDNQSDTHLLLLDALLTAGADPNQNCRRRNRRDMSGMGLALVLFESKILKRLLDAGGTVTSGEERALAEEQLQRAAANNHLATFTQLQRLVPLATNGAVYTRALTWAVEEDQADMAIHLCQLGVTPQPQTINIAMEQAGGNPQLIRALINAGADVTLPDNNGRTPIDKAMQQKSLASFQSLISLGADVNRSGSRYGLLIEAYRVAPPQRHQFIGALIDAGANLERRGEGGRTFLLEAVYRNDITGARVALQHGADSTATDSRGRTAADIALQRRFSHELMTLVGATPPTPASRIYELTSAASAGKLASVQNLVTQGIPVNHRDLNGRTPLEAAMRANHADVSEWLLKSGAAPDTTITNGSALERVSQPYSIQRLRQLRGLDKNQNVAVPMLAAAAMAGLPDMINLLTQAGADPSAMTEHGESILHLYAYSPKNPHVVIPALVSAGVPMHLFDANGYSPLTLAASQRGVALVEALVANGVDINAMDSRGNSAMTEILRAGSDPNQVRQLVQLGATISESDLEFARAKASPRTVTLLLQLRSTEK